MKGAGQGSQKRCSSVKINNRNLHPRTKGMCTTLSLALAALFIGSTQVVHAQLGNGGFETPTVANGSFQNFLPGSTIGAWTVLGNAGTNISIINTNYAEPANGMASFNAQQGLQALDLTGVNNQGTSVGVQQAVPTITGQTYALSFYVGKPNSSNGASAYAASSIADLSIDGGTRTSFTNSNTGTSGSLNWKLFEVDFTATSPSTTIAFFDGTTSTNNVELDNVQLTAVTPEPGAVALLAGLGLSTGVFIRRRRR